MASPEQPDSPAGAPAPPPDRPRLAPRPRPRRRRRPRRRPSPAPPRSRLRPPPAPPAAPEAAPAAETPAARQSPRLRLPRSRQRRREARCGCRGRTRRCEAAAAKAPAKPAAPPPPPGPPDQPPPDDAVKPAWLTALQDAVPGGVVKLSLWVGDWTVITRPRARPRGADVAARHAGRPVRLLSDLTADRLAAARPAVRRHLLPLFDAAPPPRAGEGARGGRRGRADGRAACGRRPTGSSARSSTCSGSRSSAIPTCGAS